MSENNTEIDPKLVTSVDVTVTVEGKSVLFEKGFTVKNLPDEVIQFVTKQQLTVDPSTVSEPVVAEDKPVSTKGSAKSVNRKAS